MRGAPLPAAPRPRDWLLRYLPLYAGGAAAIVAQQAVLAARDLLVRASVDGITAGDAAAGMRAAQWVLVATLAAAALRVSSRLQIFTAAARAERRMRALLLERMLNQGPGFFRRMPPGDAMSRATHDLAQVRGMLSLGVNGIVYSVCGMVSALAVMLHLSWRLTLAAMVVAPGLALTRKLLAQRLFARHHEAQESMGALSGQAFRSLAGVRAVRALGLEEAERARFAAANRHHHDALVALSRVRAAMMPALAGVASLAGLGVFGYGGWMVMSGTLSWGEFAAFWVALLRLMGPLMGLGTVAAVVQRGRAAMDRMQAVFVAVPEIAGGTHPPLQSVRGEVEARGLTFRHGGAAVLQDVSFRVPPGGSLAVLGRTGSGKSTLVRLLARLEAAPPGSLFLDGVDMCDLPLDQVRRSIAYAPQDAFLFSTTVERNAAYGLDDPDTPAAGAAVRDALARAQVLAEAQALPLGLQTAVGEWGVQLSGGQRQRVALARAMARAAPVLVLDDPLSAVDAETEARVLAEMRAWTSGRTLVLATHRTAAARRCDAILVLDGGRVAEAGTHDALMAAGGAYAALVREQDGHEPDAGGAEPALAAQGVS
ncbi:MAG: ABC transporter ATP-binding protein/permease [Gemmatimonadetes bacterium]|nr:ABC transporter ATP-binding protein/permease [Gemmatimonadota bacterium]